MVIVPTIEILAFSVDGCFSCFDGCFSCFDANWDTILGSGRRGDCWGLEVRLIAVIEQAPTESRNVSFALGMRIVAALMFLFLWKKVIENLNGYIYLVDSWHQWPSGFTSRIALLC